ncbi:MAG TPA: F0F1 ATP synthase subunit epsilon [Candidatus Paceibacterota bacterium]|nr:F0F1 ATP synthase subunit epsilon [Candidatus Paceibacterota bacterium]
MKLVIAKVNEVYFDGEADSVTLPGAEGVLTVLGHHEPLITTLKEGTIIVRAANLEGGQVSFPITKGLLEVRADGATVIL